MWDSLASIELIQRIPQQSLLVTGLNECYAGLAFWYEARGPWYAPEVYRCRRISDIHVVPASQGKGVEHALLHGTVARIRAEEIPTIFLGTSEGNLRAQNLYTSKWFVQVPPGDLRYCLDSP